MPEETAGLDQAGSNITELKKDIAAGVKQIEAQKAIRTSANEEIAAIKSNLATKGIPKKALNMAMTYANMDPDDREGFDVAYTIVREAIGLVFSSDGPLFGHAEDKQSSDEKDE